MVRPSTILPKRMVRLIASVLMLSGLTACVMPTAWETPIAEATIGPQWETLEATPQQVLAREPPPERVRVILPNRTWVVLRQPTIARDSLFGVVETGMYHGQWLRGGERTGIAVDSVRQVAVPLRWWEEPEPWWYVFFAPFQRWPP